jgi:hypothetical protein
MACDRQLVFISSTVLPYPSELFRFCDSAESDVLNRRISTGVVNPKVLSYNTTLIQSHSTAESDETSHFYLHDSH